MSLVRVRNNGLEYNVGRSHAEANGLTILDEPTHGADGRPKPTTRKDGRPRKTQTSVDQKVAEKKAAGSKSADQTEKEI